MPEVAVIGRVAADSAADEVVQLVPGGIFSFVTFVGPGMNFVWFLVATAAAIVTTFALTFVMGIQED